MTANDLSNIAFGEAARAVIVDLLKVGKVIQISVVPTSRALGFVHYDKTETIIPTVADVENHITAILASWAADQNSSSTSHSGSLEQADHLARQVADMTTPSWRQTNPEMPRDIMQRCRTRAGHLVTANKARIQKVAEALAQKGSITGAELAAISG